LQPAGILKYVEDVKREPNADIGPKDIFEIASSEKDLKQGDEIKTQVASDSRISKITL